jgi:hypothetical protein
MMWNNNINFICNRIAFKRAVLDSFGFLISEYGFALVGDDAYSVRYESGDVSVYVYHERLSYELYLTIALKTDEEKRAYSLADLLELAGVEETTRSHFQTSTQAGVKKCVLESAELVKKYADRALRGDRHTYEQLSAIQKRQSAVLKDKMELERVLPKVENAWRDRHYAEFVRLCEPIASILTPAMQKKLEYARKQISGT